MNFIITENRNKFRRLGYTDFCELDNMVLPTRIALDTETDSLFARVGNVFAVQIGTGINNYLIDLDGIPLEKVFEYIKDKECVFHNAQFDLGFFYAKGLILTKVFDTMLATQILYNGQLKFKGKSVKADLFSKGYTAPLEGASFGAVMQRELGITYDKSEQKNIATVKLTTKSAIEYCFQDVDKLLLLHDVLEKKLVKNGMMETYNLHRHAVQAVAYSELCGLPISTERWTNKMVADKIAAQEAELKVVEYLSQFPQFRNKQLSLFSDVDTLGINLQSPQQMQEVFDFLGVKITDADGNITISKDTLSKSSHPFIKLWLDFSEKNHKCTTFGKNILDKVEKTDLGTYLFPRIKLIMNTGRMATEKGLNIMNFPSDRSTRECFQASFGNLIVAADYSSQISCFLLQNVVPLYFIK